MSELQFSLLVIGIGVIVVLYAFGWWKQKQYQQRFEGIFKPPRNDALYENPEAETADTVESKSSPNISDAGLSESDSAGSFIDETCSILDVRDDFIIEIHAASPHVASVLNGLWQRKFDFGKPVHVCGMTFATKKWERVIPESQTLYKRFRLALQLVDRGGPISAAKLADFRDLVSGIAQNLNADTSTPDVDETHRRAIDLDAFCASVDQMVGVNLMPPGKRLLLGSKISQSATLLGMTLESDGAFHQLDEQGHSLFSLTNRDAKPFQHHLLETSGSAGITLLLDVPRVSSPTEKFDEWMQVAHGLGKGLQVNLVDDHDVPLSESGLALIRTRIEEIEAKMTEYGITPGSPQAHRLFS